MEEEERYEYLPAYEFYSKLNENVADEDKEKPNKYWERIEPIFEPSEQVRDIVYKLQRNVTFLNENRDDDQLYGKHCYDLNYWLYEQVYKKFNLNENNIHFFITLDILLNSWENMNADQFNGKNDICQPDNTLVDINYLKEIKYLGDYVENFNTIKSAAIEDTNKACNVYIDYLRYAIPAYYEWNKLCTLEEENLCNKYIHDYEKYDPKGVLSNLSVTGLAVAQLFNKCYKNIVNIFLSTNNGSERTTIKLRNGLETISYGITENQGRSLSEVEIPIEEPTDMFAPVTYILNSIYSIISEIYINSYNDIILLIVLFSAILITFFGVYKITKIVKSTSNEQNRSQNTQAEMSL
ncbi:PIR protein CIR protein [Plasmodium vinckei brucechwatti]|uniref:PIR protein CIR protein n=1 Tax=Plasmodium vinckei brucechwatti TaxID=119398 RepID=A0A6V7RT19_PLAVN|nr:PIR protein CIR protein [Plasmodium vinckei brucechwatti]